MRAWTHLFGSIDGYRTLARSTGLTESEDSALASLGFGSPRTDAEFERLEAGLCMAGRLLPSGRYAITRVFPGPPDVAGRRTIERRTLVLEAEDWTQLAAADLKTTLSAAENWEREAFREGHPIDVRLHADAAPRGLPTEADRRACDALLSAHAVGRCALLPDTDIWSAAVLRLSNLLPVPQLMGLGWGVGLWAVPAGVWIATARTEVAPRGSFLAPTAGAWKHPEQVMRLGRNAIAPVPMDPATPRSRRRPSALRHLPLIAALLVMAIASLLISWAVRERAAARRSDAIEVRRATPPSTPPSDPSTQTPTSAETAATQPAPIAPDTQPEASPSVARETAPTGFGAASSAPAMPDAFGSGNADPMRATTMDSAAAQPSAEQPQPVAQPTQPDPATAAPVQPAPTERPNIPDVPTETTPWDPQVALARKAIELHEAARSATTEQDGASLVGKLAALADSLLKSHKEADAKGSAPSERCLILIDARNGKRGLTDTIKREHLAATFSPLLIQRMLLLCARFEISLSIQALESRKLIDMAALPLSLRGDVKANGWPDDMPWKLWYSRSRDTAVSTAMDGARFMASEFDGALDGQQGTRNAQEVLESLARRTVAEGAP